MAVDVISLWDFGKPELSEQRFREALSEVSADDQLILQTQIARSFGLRQDFVRAREILAGIEPSLQSSSDEVGVRYFLELGRTYSSTTHDGEKQTESDLEQARSCFTQAFELAKATQLDYLAIDALHMMALVDTSPDDQLAWDLKCIEYMDASTQSEAKKWEGSLRNNVGYALHLAGRYDEALTQFNLALDLRQQSGKIRGIRAAYWMIAWTLRAMGRIEEALEIQLRLEQEWEADGEPSKYVFEELEHLYLALDQPDQAERYRKLRGELEE